jgi:hypothetical protein
LVYLLFFGTFFPFWYGVPRKSGNPDSNWVHTHTYMRLSTSSCVRKRISAYHRFLKIVILFSNPWWAAFLHVFTYPSEKCTSHKEECN